MGTQPGGFQTRTERRQVVAKRPGESLIRRSHVDVDFTAAIGNP
jgi:hypothetical protein